MKPFRVGIDSYSLSPLKASPFGVLDWASAHGAAGVHFTELNLADGRIDEGFLRELGQHARRLELYLEWGGGQHVPFDTRTWRPRDLQAGNLAAARQAAALGTSVIRSCSGGLFRWGDEAPPTEALLRAMGAALTPQMPLLAELGVVLAIELHFEFTTFELVRLFERCGAEPGGPLGICLDPMNLLTMLEDPVAGTERVLPWVVATHAKDGALVSGPEGLISFPVEVGTGQVDFERIIRRLAALGRNVNLSVEDHGGSFHLPVQDPVFLSRFPDLTTLELSRLFRMAQAGDAAVRDGRLAITKREAWPELCEQRVARGVASLKRMVNRLVEKGKAAGRAD